MHIVVGASLQRIGRYYDELYSTIAPKSELPSLTSLVVEYISSSTPMLVGLILSVVSSIGLGFVVALKRTQPILPFAIVVFWVIELMHFANCWMGFTTGLVSVLNQSHQ